MKSLLPSLKEKKRYIAFDVITEKNLNQDDIEGAIYSNCKSFIGNLNYSKAGINILSELGSSKKGVIRVTNKYTDHVKSALMMIKEINRNKVIVKSTKVSGVLKNLKKGG